MKLKKSSKGIISVGIFVLAVILSVTLLSTSFFAQVDDTYTKSLLHFNGTDTSTTITDESGKTWTAYGNAQLKTSTKKYGTASLYLDGIEDYIQTPNHSDFLFGNSDFTIDCWVNFSSLSGHQEIVARWDYNTSGTNNSWHLYWNGNNSSLNFDYSLDGTGAANFTHIVSLSTDTWYHIALTRYDGRLYMFVDGILHSMYTINDSTIYSGTEPLLVGCRRSSSPVGLFNGYIDELRISKGIGRWTTDFTPPTGEYAPTPTPSPTPEPTATPAPTLTPTPAPTATPAPSGDMALLRIKMVDGSDYEYELSMTEVNAFKSWHNNRANGTGDATYCINKSFNMGPFNSRQDYIVFDKIVKYEIMDYSSN